MIAEITDSSNLAQAYSYLPIAWSTGGTLGYAPLLLKDDSLTDKYIQTYHWRLPFETTRAFPGHLRSLRVPEDLPLLPCLRRTGDLLCIGLARQLPILA